MSTTKRVRGRGAPPPPLSPWLYLLLPGGDTWSEGRGCGRVGGGGQGRDRAKAPCARGGGGCSGPEARRCWPPGGGGWYGSPHPTSSTPARAPGPLLSSGVGPPLGSPCGCLRLSRHTTPSSHAPTPAPSAPPPLAVCLLFWQEALVVPPDQLAPLLGSVAISGGAEAEARVGVDVCSDDGLPAPRRASGPLPL